LRSRAQKIVMVLAGPDHSHDVTVAVAQLVDDPSILTTIVVEPATGAGDTAARDRPEGFGAQVAFDPWRAARGLWPAVDAMRTTVASYPSARHEQLAGQARAAIERYAAMDPHLEMNEHASYADPALAARAQELHRYLAQPFALWEHQTSLPGESTPYAELLDRIECLLEGNCLP